MPIMSRYAKAYPLSAMRTYERWAEQIPIEDVPSPEDAAGFVFLHENLTVTKGVYVDEEIIFESTAQEWADFCKKELQFAIPADVAALELDDLSEAAAETAQHVSGAA